MTKTWKHYAMYSGIASGSLFVIGSIIAMLTYPNYSLTEKFFSDTGLRLDQVGEDGTIYKAHPMPYIFNTTLYIVGSLLFPFFVAIPSIMSQGITSTVSKIMYYLATLLGLIMVPAVILVGVYDWGTDLLLHALAAQTTMAMILFFMLFWTLADYFLNSDHPYKPKSKFKQDALVSLFIILITYPLVGLPTPGFYAAIAPYQVYQKTAIYSALLYISVLARRMLNLTEKDD